MSAVLKTTSNVFAKSVTQLLKPLDNKVFGTTVRVALILYASLIAPELPESVARQLNNTAVRAVLIFVIAYLAIKDPITAALATLALMVSVMSLHRSDVQSVLGKVASHAEGAVDQTQDVVGDVLGKARQVAGRVVGLAQQGPTEKETAPVVQVPSGVEAGMDNAGAL